MAINKEYDAFDGVRLHVTLDGAEGYALWFRHPEHEETRPGVLMIDEIDEFMQYLQYVFEPWFEDYRAALVQELADKYPTASRDMVSRGSVKQWLISQAEIIREGDHIE